ncbi:MAG: hypothetical protein E7441_00895 [Ruminococcaceae bacterium]|nr:hypothetical protein [Oscillospiraceae bacterium]
MTKNYNSDLQRQAKQFINVGTFDRSIKNIDTRVECVRTLLNEREVYDFFNVCEKDVDKRAILDRISYAYKKEQGGTKIEYNYHPLDLAADYILAMDESGLTQTREAFDESLNRTEKHQHNKKTIEVRPMSYYERDDEEGNTYTIIENALLTDDVYFSDVNSKEVVSFLNGYGIRAKAEVDFLRLKTSGKTSKEIKTEIGLTESQQRTILKNLAKMITGTKIIEIPCDTEKTCKCCGEVKPLTEFAKEKRNKDGRKNICKKCDAKRKSK